MITNQQLAKLIQDTLNGSYNAEAGDFANIAKFRLNEFTSNVRYEFNIFANDGEYIKAENRDALPTGEATNTVTQYINGVLKTPGGSPASGISPETLNTAFEANLELLIPNCDETATFTLDGVEVKIRLQDLVALAVQEALSLPLDVDLYDEDGVMYSVGGRFAQPSIAARQHRTQAGLSVILSLFCTFSVVAQGVNSRKYTITIDGEPIYYNRISISRASTQENNVTARPNADTPTTYGVSKARTTATQLIIAFSAPVRPTALNNALTRYLLLGEVETMSVTLSMPTETDENGNLEYLTATFSMVFAEGGVAGEENLNASFDIRLVEEMEDANG